MNQELKAEQIAIKYLIKIDQTPPLQADFWNCFEAICPSTSPAFEYWKGGRGRRDWYLVPKEYRKILLSAVCHFSGVEMRFELYRLEIGHYLDEYRRKNTQSNFLLSEFNKFCRQYADFMMNLPLARSAWFDLPILWEDWAQIKVLVQAVYLCRFKAYLDFFRQEQAFVGKFSSKAAQAHHVPNTIETKVHLSSKDLACLPAIETDLRPDFSGIFAPFCAAYFYDFLQEQAAHEQVCALRLPIFQHDVTKIFAHFASLKNISRKTALSATLQGASGTFIFQSS